MFPVLGHVLCNFREMAHKREHYYYYYYYYYNSILCKILIFWVKNIGPSRRSYCLPTRLNVQSCRNQLWAVFAVSVRIQDGDRSFTLITNTHHPLAVAATMTMPMHFALQKLQQ